jgi:hypothetical protein
MTTIGYRSRKMALRTIQRKGLSDVPIDRLYDDTFAIRISEEKYRIPNGFIYKREGRWEVERNGSMDFSIKDPLNEEVNQEYRFNELKKMALDYFWEIEMSFREKGKTEVEMMENAVLMAMYACKQINDYK